MIPDIAHLVRIGPTMLARVGLFDVETIQPVLDAYTLVEQYFQHLIQLGGKQPEQMPSQRRVAMMKTETARYVITMHNKFSEQMARAIAKLDDFLRSHPA